METSQVFGQLRVDQYVVGPLDNNLYVLSTQDTSQAMLIDATGDDLDLLTRLVDRGVTRALITHGHDDHIGGVAHLRQLGVQVLVGEPDAALLDGYDIALVDNEVIRLGEISLQVLATPGHTPGSICLGTLGQRVLFTGDTLFPGGPGATKFPGGDFPTIIRSLRRLFAMFDDDTVVLPGHGAPTTIGAESGSLDDWIARGW
jgi:glyoxylase-like metal-dependent hydrolase (beta-lactamase superfamily II)